MTLSILGARLAAAMVTIAGVSVQAGPMVIHEVISREVGMHVGGVQDPEIREVISREVAIFVGGDLALPIREIVSREVSIGVFNFSPVAGSDIVVRLDTSVTAKVLLTELLSNDVDDDGDPLRIASVGNAHPVGATVAFVGNWVVYTVPAMNSGSGGFTYTLTDGPGGHSVEGTVTVIETNPPLPDGSPNFVALTPLGADFRISFIGVPGREYRVQYTTESGPPYNWSEFIPPAEIMAPANGVFHYTDLNPVEPMRLYRAVYQP